MVKVLKKLLFLLMFFISNSTFMYAHNQVKQYFATAADEFYFPWFLQLIGSLHHHNFDAIKEIAVFDLGFNEQQKNLIRRMAKVTLCQPEITHPDLLTQFKTNTQGKTVRGWFAWKPVVIKQALEMFPYVVYLDGGCVVMRPSDDIFRYLIAKNYFLIRDQEWFVDGQNKLFTIQEMCVRAARLVMQLDTPERSWILKQPGITAGAQGLTRQMMENYVLPMYELTKDLRNFADDGSAQLGFGWGRHDQTLFSIQAHLLKLDLIVPGRDIQLSVDDLTTCVFVSDFIGHTPHIFYNCKGQVVMQEKIRWRA